MSEELRQVCVCIGHQHDATPSGRCGVVEAVFHYGPVFCRCYLAAGADSHPEATP